MAKLTDLTLDNAPSGDDLLYIVNAPGGTPGSRKTTVADLAASSSFSSLYGSASTLSTVVAGLAAHLADTTDAHDASAISFTPAGSISATDVQAALVEVAAEAGVGSGDALYSELQDNVGVNRITPSYKSSYPHRAASMWLTQTEVQAVRELWLGDSFGISGASTPGRTDMLSVYEDRMARAYNRLPRTDGFIPAEMYTAIGGVWYSLDSVPANQRTTRGPQASNKLINTGQSASQASAGTGVTIYYTAYRTGGAVVDVTINGTSVGSIDSTDAGITLGVDYDSGRTATFDRPSIGAYGDIELTITYTSGTSFELEGVYFHTEDNQVGYQLLRGDLPGKSIDYWIDAVTGIYLMQYIANVQPEIVTICLGVNDAQTIGLNHSAATVAADLGTLIADIRAQYSTWEPAIRYIFQHDSTFMPATWPTDYRDALRDQCITDEVLFLDANALVGSIRASDDLNVSDDTLHPNDYGSAAYAEMMADITVRKRNAVVAPFSLSTATAQEVTATSGALNLWNAAGASIALARNTGSATGTSAQLGYIGFSGAANDYGAITFGAAVRGMSDGAASWTATSRPGRIEFMTVTDGATALAVRAGINNAGKLYIGATAAAAVAEFDASGNGRLTAGLVLGNSVAATAPVTSLDLYTFANTPNASFFRANGSATAPTAISTNNNMGRLNFRGYDGSSYIVGGFVQMLATENWSVGNNGTYMTFTCTPSGSATFSERLRLYGTPRWAAFTSGVQIAGGGSGTALTVASSGGALDITDGLVQLRPVAITLTNTAGLNSDLALPTSTFSRVTAAGSTGNFSLGGFVIPTNGNGMTFWFQAQDANDAFAIINEDASSTAANRILTGTGSSLYGLRRAKFGYDGAQSRWVVLAYNRHENWVNALGSIGGGSTSVDPTVGNVVTATLGGNHTFNAASVLGAGHTLTFQTLSDTSNRVITWGTNLLASGGGTATTTASTSSLFVFRSDGSNWMEVSRTLNVI